MPKKNTLASEIPSQPLGRLMKLLVAFDGSPHAQAALELLLDLPLSNASPLTLLAVMPAQWITGHEQLQAALNQAQELLMTKFKNIKAELKAGNPPATINAAAEELQADLTVVGAKGLRATLGILLGGVAQQVVEYSCCPVLVVRAPYHGLRRILVVTDGSPSSQKTLEYVAGMGCGVFGQRCGLPLPAEAEIKVMHVLPPVVSPEIAMRAWTVGPEALYPAPIEGVDWEKIQAEEEKQAQAMLDEALSFLRTAGVIATKVLRHGDAATEILETIKSQQIDLVVCGSRGLSQVAGWLLGSVSRKLVHYAGCSVLIVK